MALTAMGMTGTVDQVGDAQRWAIMGPRFRVGSAADLKPAVSTSANLTINIAAGLGMCCGVFGSQTVTSPVVVQANTSGSDRLDTIVLRFTWANPGSVTLAVVKGNSPTTPVAPTWTPGGTYDAVLAYVLVRNGVGLINANDVYDVRVWGGVGSADFETAAPAASPYAAYIDLPSHAVLLSSDGLRRQYNGYSAAFGSVAGGNPLVVVTRSVDQTVQTDQNLSIGFNTFDGDTSSYTFATPDVGIVLPGWYEANAAAHWDPAPNGLRALEIFGGGQTFRGGAIPGSGGGNIPFPGTSANGVFYATAGSQVGAYAWQNSGGNLNLKAAVNGLRMSVKYLHA